MTLQARRWSRQIFGFTAVFVFCAAAFAAEEATRTFDIPSETRSSAVSASQPGEIEQLKRQLADLQEQVNQLRTVLLALHPNGGATEVIVAANDKRGIAEVASLTPVIPSSVLNTVAVAPAPLYEPSPQAAAASQDGARIDAVQKAVDAINANLRGFRLSGDLRFRTDILYREANKDLPPGDNRATPAQRARERYRVRLNVDKDLFWSDKSDRALAHAHVQLATDPFNNPNTMDTDFAGIATRAPISIAEAYIDFAPLKSLTFRIGRTPELFADNRQFVYDDDIRFNGFHETYRWAGKKNGLFVQVAGAQYILTDPNIQVTPAGSPFLAAGYKVGQRIPSSALFDQGVTVGSNIGKKWSHNETFAYFSVREPNQIQLASTANGAALFANNPILGAVLISNLGETGNGTTTAGGAIYTANDFHVVRGGFNLNYSGTQWRGHNVPFQFFVQGTHNTGASFDNNGFMIGAAIGQATRPGDIQLQYQYFYKPGNAFISQFSDDDVGSGAGTNVKNNQVRINFGLTRFLAWENRFYIQKGISVNNAARNYFLPFQQGYNTQLRIHSQFVFTF